MKTEELKELGLNDEQVKGVFALRGKELNPLKEAAAELETAKATIAERDGQLEQLRKAGGDAEALKATIEQLQKDNKTAVEAHEAQLRQLRSDAAVERALTAAGAKHMTAAKSLLAEFLSTAELTSDGTLKGLEDKIKELVSGSDTGFLFESEAGEQFKMHGAKPANPPRNPPSAQVSELEGRYAEAKKSNNTAAQIQIKREASEAGIFLA